MRISEFIDRCKILSFSAFIRIADFFNAYNLLARYSQRHVSEIRNGKIKSNYLEDEYKNIYTILVLDYQRFRGDIDIFSSDDRVRILCISWGYLRYLLAAFVHEPTLKQELELPKGTNPRHEFAKAKSGSKIFEQREKYRIFLNSFLPKFLGRLGVDVIMNSDYRYRRETDFSNIASNLNFPHICYFREAMYIVPAIYQKGLARYIDMAPFKGDVIAVQNNETGNMLIEAGLVNNDEVVVRGCPRMDEYCDEIKNKSLGLNKKQIVYFSCPRGVPINDGSYFDFFSNSKKIVRALVELAYDDRDIKVILKIKDQHMKGRGQGQIGEFASIINEVTGKNETLSNIIIETDRMAAHKVILQSSIVCAMQSTVALEAAITGMPVILPHLNELIEQKGSEQALMYHEFRDIFDVPKDVNDFKEIVCKRFNGYEVPEEIINKRFELFERFVSPIDGSSTEKSISLLCDYAEEGRKMRNDYFKTL